MPVVCLLAYALPEWIRQSVIYGISLVFDFFAHLSFVVMCVGFACFLLFRSFVVSLFGSACLRFSGRHVVLRIRLSLGFGIS